jgi:hypothetical protein
MLRKNFMNCFSGMIRRALLAVPVFVSAIAAVPVAQASTLAFSGAQAQMSNFSHVPLGTTALADSDTTAFQLAGTVEVQADATALFTQILAVNDSFGAARGEGTFYGGTATSFARVVGTFLIQTQEEFSFNFASGLGLQVAVDAPDFESATASGAILFNLFDDTTGGLIDSFGLAGQLSTGSGHGGFAVSKSPFIQGKPASTVTSEGSGALGVAEFTGLYARWFKAPTVLRLEEVKTNDVQVQACR